MAYLRRRVRRELQLLDANLPPVSDEDGDNDSEPAL
jgi:hypothetical protein